MELLEVLQHIVKDYANTTINQTGNTIQIAVNDKVVITINTNKRTMLTTAEVNSDLHADVFDNFLYYATPKHTLRVDVVGLSTEFCPYVVRGENGFEIVDEEEIGHYELADYTFTAEQCEQAMESFGALKHNIVVYDRF